MSVCCDKPPDSLLENNKSNRHKLLLPGYCRQKKAPRLQVLKNAAVDKLIFEFLFQNHLFYMI